MSKNILIYIFGLLFIGAIIYMSFLDSKKYDEIKKNGIELVGTVQTRGSDIYIDWQVDNSNKRKTLSKPYPTIKTGEQFKIYYLNQYPDMCYIDFSQPVYDRNRFAITECLSVDQVDDYTVNFKYIVDGKKHSRFMDLELKDLSASEVIVVYDTTNTQIAYLERKT